MGSEAVDCTESELVQLATVPADTLGDVVRRAVVLADLIGADDDEPDILQSLAARIRDDLGRLAI